MADLEKLSAMLAAPFDEREVKSREQSGKTFRWVTARTVENRLDAVLGVMNWEDEYVRDTKWVTCRLTLTLPDGRKVSKMGAGGIASKVQEEDQLKTGHTDAFKLAARKFGVGRYLYEDGVVDYEAVGGPTVNLDAVQVNGSHTQQKPLQQPYRPSPEAPRSFDNFRPVTKARGVYPWTITMEEHFQGVPVKKMVDNVRKEMGIKEWKSSDWTDEQATEVTTEVIEQIRRLNCYNGEFDAVPISPSPVDDLPTLKKQLYEELKTVFAKQNNGATPNVDQLRELLAALSPFVPTGKGMTGEVSFSISAITDPVWIRNMIANIRSKTIDVAVPGAEETDPDCPF